MSEHIASILTSLHTRLTKLESTIILEGKHKKDFSAQYKDLAGREITQPIFPEYMTWTSLWSKAKDWEEEFDLYLKNRDDPPESPNGIAKWIIQHRGPYPATKAWAERQLSARPPPPLDSVKQLLAALRSDGLAPHADLAGRKITHPTSEDFMSWTKFWSEAKDWEEEGELYLKNRDDPPQPRYGIAMWVREHNGPYPATKAWAERQLSARPLPTLDSVKQLLAALRADGLAGRSPHQDLSGREITHYTSEDSMSWTKLWSEAKDWEEEFDEPRYSGDKEITHRKNLAMWVREHDGPYPATKAWAESYLTSRSQAVLPMIELLLEALRKDGLARPA